jgi:PAS domain S-box-containing protein
MTKKNKGRLYDEQDLSSIFDAAPDATLLVNADGYIERLNTQAEKLFGYKREEMLGQPIELLVPERARKIHVEHRREFADNLRVRAMGSSLELYARRKDGLEFPIDVNLSPIQLQGRKIVSASIRDVTDRKEVASQLADTVEQLRSERDFSASLITTQQSIVLVLDSKGQITLVNPYFEDLMGYGAKEILGLDWFDTFIPEDERPKIQSFFAQVMREGINRGYINAVVTKGGEQRMVQWQSKTLQDADGSIVGLLNTGYDVTEQQAAAVALRAAKEEADRANSGKTRFLAAASHDLRQPLQSVGLYLSVLARQLHEPESQDIGNKMRQSLDTMGEILDALLDISKLESGSVEAQAREFPLQEMLDQIDADNSPLAERKGLSLRIEPTTVIVKSDPALLQRIIDNFVGNALRYTGEGEVSIKCRSDGDNARIEVSDTGIGIPEDARESIFEEYFQLDNPVRDRSKGLGLGLAIVRHIARLLDHALDVQSAPGEGSTFSVILPKVGTISESEFHANQPDVSAPTSDAVTVLVVDDDPAIIDATVMLLEIEGFDVHAAPCGDDALTIIEDGLRPDIVLSDYRLPGANGTEVVRRIRQLAGDDLPAILMTGDTSANEIAAAGLEHCTVLHKPINSERLISLIHKSFGSSANTVNPH